MNFDRPKNAVLRAHIRSKKKKVFVDMDQMMADFEAGVRAAGLPPQVDGVSA